MRNHNAFRERLKLLNSIEISQLKGYDVGKLLFNNILEIETLTGFSVVKKTIHRVLFDPFSYKISNYGEQIVVLDYPYGRVDHEKSWEQFKQLFDEKTVISLIQNPGKPFNISMILALESIKVFISVAKQLRQVGIGKETFKLASDLLGVYRIKRKLDTEPINAKCYISFFDGNLYENFFTQWMQNHGITTITLQHGQPVFHGYDVDYMNQTMILNFSSDYIIVPGRFSEKQFLAGKIPQRCIKVLGSLREIHNITHFKKNKLFCLILDTPTFDFAKKVNIMMINICEEYARRNDYSYIIKPHPHDSIDNYSNIKLLKGKMFNSQMYINDVISNSDFCVMHFTGAYLDSIADMKKVFLFNSMDNYMMSDIDDELFVDYNELNYKIKEWDKKTDEEKHMYLKEIIEYYLDPNASKERHISFIRECIDNS